MLKRARCRFFSTASAYARFPQVMRVIGPLHKTDVGGVVVGIDALHSAVKTWSELMNIPDTQGVFIQAMIDGTEVILGACRESDSGHLVILTNS